MIRRQLLSKIPQLFGLGLLGLGAAGAQETTAHKPLKIMMKGAWGSDPTKAPFPSYMSTRLPKLGMKSKSSSWAKPFRYAKVRGKCACASRLASSS